MNTEQELEILRNEMRAVIKNLESREWIQGKEVDGDKVCAHGAVKTCEVLRPGDEYIIRAVMRTKGLTEDWNDEPDRTKAEVLARIRQIEVSDADLEATFGPNWRLVIAVVRRAAVLTVDEAQRMVDALIYGATPDAAWAAAWDAARGSDSARVAAWHAAWAAAWHAAGAAAEKSARDAACAAVVADLVGQHGLTQDHIDTLMKPWIEALGEDWEKDV